MPNAYFITFELIIYLQFALCLNHALKHGTASLLKLGFGILFGVTLELATIRQLNAYEYGQFLLMVLDVPQMRSSTRTKKIPLSRVLINNTYKVLSHGVGENM